MTSRRLLEHLFTEARRRTKVIPHAFGEGAFLKLVYTVLMRTAERYRGGSASPSSSSTS